MGISTYGGEDSPVLGGEIAEGFGIELHCGLIVLKMCEGTCVVV